LIEKVNESNWRLKSGGAPINKAVHNAAGAEFTSMTKRYYPVAEVGGAYPVPLSASSPLLVGEGVHWVIHVVTPNINPAKSNAIANEEIAHNLLKATYEKLFDTFFELVILLKS